MKRRFVRMLSAAAAASVLATAPPAAAHFEHSAASSRDVALGGALVTIVGDASASVINPAALVQVHRWSAISTYERPYGVDGLDEAFAAGAMRVDGVGAFGLAVHYTGLRDVMTESLITLAYARDLIRTSEDASLSAGVSVDLARVSVQEGFDASQSEVTGAASILLRPFPAIGLAYVMRNIREPSFDLVPGGGVTTLERTQSWGVSYVWHQRVALSYERRNDTGRWRDHLGVEVDLVPGLDLRTGVARGAASGGVGLSWGAVTLDAGFSSHEYLGSSYVLTVGYTPAAPANPYAQTP